MPVIDNKQSHKMNLIDLAKHHKKYCEGEHCTISLGLLMVLAEESGIEFTKEEREIFL